ncbi:protein of unknown function [Candidatus Hydrogenisulfobacillus filiaventi]|uniref:Uncharacterized protein n=1 Tax=Candidatus Hydrogenisulfobacillus filiaventi TaxID=2707344 RepID=A0A6F8ZH04_9FIRM|nr:protein of unknown function [Candidatus Hydrogenisulfobacillus filiaventi]
MGNAASPPRRENHGRDRAHGPAAAPSVRLHRNQRPQWGIGWSRCPSSGAGWEPTAGSRGSGRRLGPAAGPRGPVAWYQHTTAPARLHVGNGCRGRQFLADHARRRKRGRDAVPAEPVMGAPALQPGLGPGRAGNGGDPGGAAACAWVERLPLFLGVSWAMPLATTMGDGYRRRVGTLGGQADRDSPGGGCFRILGVHPGFDLPDAAPGHEIPPRDPPSPVGLWLYPYHGPLYPGTGAGKAAGGAGGPH